MDPGISRIPAKGRDRQEILAEMEHYRSGDVNYRDGQTFSLVYYMGEEHNRFLKEAHNKFFSENALNPMAFESLKRFETDVIRQTAAMLHGDEGTCGTMTSGGTESCLLAVKTYRDLARTRKPWIRKPEMVAPESIHVAFEKGASYFGVKVKHAPLGPDFRVDVNAVRKLVNRNTVLIVGSAPSYPHGVVDPIEELGGIAADRDIPLHVDSCLGGFLLPWVEKLGYRVPVFDFRVPAVMSMTADVHKYGYAAKGASAIIYRNVNTLKHQMFVYENWPGGIFGSSALLGTRPGGSIAAAWAVLQAMGEEGYVDAARVIMETTKKMIDGINAIPELEVLGEPHMSVFAYASNTKDLNVYAVADRMEQKGWYIDRQHRPECLHAMVTPAHAASADRFLDDLAEAVDFIRRNPELATSGGAAMYGMISKVPLRGMIRQQVLKMMLDMYGPDGKMPDLEGKEAPDLATKAGILFLKLRERFGRRRR